MSDEMRLQRRTRTRNYKQKKAKAWHFSAPSNKSRGRRPRGPEGQATVDYLTGQGNAVLNERE